MSDLDPFGLNALAADLRSIATGWEARATDTNGLRAAARGALDPRDLADARWRVSRIVGGTEARPHEFPWQVAI